MSALEGRAVVVTGGASGLGAAIARRVAEEGAHAVVADLDELGAARVVESIRERGGAADAVVCDVRSEAGVERLFARASGIAPLGAVVLGAAIERRAPLLETADEDWQDVLDTNLKGPFLCMKHAIEPLAAAGGGSIVALGSTLGLIASPGYSAYVASKGALANLCKLAAVDTASRGVRVNLVAPAATDTGLFMRVSARAPDPEALRTQVGAATPLGRLGRGSEVVDTVMYLLGDAASYVSGAVVPVDGGLAARRSWMG